MIIVCGGEVGNAGGAATAGSCSGMLGDEGGGAWGPCPTLTTTLVG